MSYESPATIKITYSDGFNTEFDNALRNLFIPNGYIELGTGYNFMTRERDITFKKSL